MRREGWLINHKKTHRIYCEEGLNLRRKRPRRRVAAAHRVERPDIAAPDQVWSMDFVADELFNGQRIRALTVVDNFSRQSLAIDVDFRLNGEAVVDTMMRLLSQSRRPKRIQVDNVLPAVLMELMAIRDSSGITRLPSSHSMLG